MPRKISQPSSRRRAEGKAAGSGTPADRLIRAWLDGDDDTFADLAEGFIAGSRDGVLHAAVRKFSERYEEEAVDEFALALTELAEVVEGQAGFDLAEMVLLPVVTAGAPPDPAWLARGLLDAGILPPEAQARFAEGWHTAETIGSLSPGAVRRVLLDLAGGRQPADLPPQSLPDSTEGMVLVLVGAVAFGAEPVRDDPDADPELRAAAAQAAESAQANAFERWRSSLDPARLGNALLLPLCSPSELADEIDALLEEDEVEDTALDEIADFVETARDEAAGEEVVARLAIRAEGVEITVLTRAGRMLDSRVFAETEGELTAEDIRRIVGACVPILEDPA